MERATVPRRGLTKGQRTRQRLLRAAVERFGEHGFRGTSVSQLSRDAGLTPAAAYAYFTDKEAFWAAAIEADLDDLDAEIREAALSSDSPLLTLMLTLVEGLQRHPLTRRVFEEGTLDDLQLVLAHRLFASTRQTLTRRLTARRDAGVLPPSADPARLALGIETVMFSIVISGVRAGLDGDLERLTAVVDLVRLGAGGPPRPEEIPTYRQT